MQKFCSIRRTNILLVAILLMMALDCFAQKPMSLWRLKHQDIYVLDSCEIPKESKATYHVVSSTTDKNKVYRLWILKEDSLKNFKTSALQFPNLQELRNWSCYMPKDFYKYKNLQILEWKTEEEICTGCARNLTLTLYSNGYIDLLDFVIPKQLYELNNLKVLKIHAPNGSMIVSEDIRKLSKLKELELYGNGMHCEHYIQMHVPACLMYRKTYHKCRHKNCSTDFSSFDTIIWRRKPVKDFSSKILKKKTYNKNGHVFIEAQYKRGLPDGKWLVYDKDGNVIQTRYYKNGVEHGIWRFNINDPQCWSFVQEEVYNNGQLTTIIFDSLYVLENYNDFPNRVKKKYDKEGHVEQEYIYKNTVIVEKIYRRFSEGKLVSEEHFYPEKNYCLRKYYGKAPQLVDGNVIRSDLSLYNLAVEEIFEPNYLRFETEIINEEKCFMNNYELMRVTVYDKDDNIIMRRTGAGELENFRKQMKEFANTYLEEQKNPLNTKKNVTIKEIYEPYYLKIVTYYDDKYAYPTFYDKDGTIHFRWIYDHSFNNIRTMEEKMYYMDYQKQLDKLSTNK